MSQYKIVPFGSTFEFLFFNKKYRLVALFLASDVQYGGARFSSKFIGFLKTAMDEQVEPPRLIGNAYELTIKPETTRVTYIFSENRRDYCFIKTRELYEIVLLWTIEVEKFKKIKETEKWSGLDDELKIYCFLGSIFHRLELDFDGALAKYLSSESIEGCVALNGALVQFLKSDCDAVLKNEYIAHCADGINFEQFDKEPTVWLAQILNQVEAKLAEPPVTFFGRVKRFLNDLYGA